jgi:multiple sugar transport system substrate-binding protein
MGESIDTVGKDQSAMNFEKGGTMKRRKLFFAAFLFIFVVIGVLGNTVPAQAEKLVIAGRDGVYGKSLERAVQEFQKENPGVQVELLKLPYGSLYEKLVISFREGSGAYDLVMLDDTWATEYMANGWLLDLEGAGLKPDTDFIGNALAVGRYPYKNGKLYALPIVGNVELFAYRKDLFEKHGLSEPQTWLDVVEAAVKIQASEEGVKGVVFRGTKGNPIVTGFLPILWGFGASVVGPDGKARLNTRNAEAALELFLKLKAYAPQGVEMYNSSEVRDAIQQGDVAIAIEVWPSWVPAMDDPGVSKVVKKVEVKAAPGLIASSSPMLGAWLMGVSAQSKSSDLALKFLKFLTSATMQKTLAMDIGLPPTRRSVYIDKDVVAKYRWYPSQLQALEAAKPRPRITQWSQVESILGDYLQLALTGSLKPAKALEEANQKITGVLSK